MDKICIYLRKSRADEEVEKALGQGETLIKHRKALLKYAKEKQLNIVDIKEELVSGDSLFHRPKMLELIKEMKQNLYTGVLVMDMQRLVRGDMEDQGTILKAFKSTHTLIITPQRTYNLDNEFDEEYVEFEFFMGRKEYKMINRRMQGARIRSVEEGNYIATNPPLGYDIRKERFFRTLTINENEADVIRLIFDKYINGYGATAIADYLNDLGYKTKMNRPFTNSSVLFIIRNPVYIGKITWKKKDIKKSTTPGKAKDTRTRDKSEWIISDGKHEPIISEEVFNKANLILNNKYHIPYQLENEPVNPLAGIVVCAFCGKKMIMRKLRGVDRIMCYSKCGNQSMKFEDFEKQLINALEDYLSNYDINIETSNKASNVKIYERKLSQVYKDLETLNNQKLSLYDYLERGIYTEEIFLERSANLDGRIEEAENNIKILKENIERERTTPTLNPVRFNKLLQGYKNAKSVVKKNMLMKELVSKVEYTRVNKKLDLKLHHNLKHTTSEV